MRQSRLLLPLLALILPLNCLAAGLVKASFSLSSPDKRLEVRVTTGGEVRWSVLRDGAEVISPSPLSLTLGDGTVLGHETYAPRSARTTVNGKIGAALYKKSTIPFTYNELKLSFKNFDLIFRAYDEGVAYRFVPKVKGPFKVTSEEVSLSFAGDFDATFPYVRASDGDSFDKQFFSSFENLYTKGKLSDMDPLRLVFLPMNITLPDGGTLCITETDLLNYPGLYLNGNGKASLSGVFAPYPKTVVQGGHNKLQGLVTEREDYIAAFDAAEPLPWRVFIFADKEISLVESDLPYLLARPADRDLDFSWVKPGKVAWDWWNDWNLYNVDFESGINNPTYKYFIDFAAANGIEYVILDEGWAVNGKADLFQVIDEIDLPALAAYAGSKGVGLILWAGYLAFDRDMEKVCREYSRMGIKGFKVDFMDRDDQQVVAFYERAARTAAKYRLMLDFHGAFKPAGIQRTWPNVINFEGVYGLENTKWGKTDMVPYDLQIPFIRNVAGPMDYTQGAMRNATRANYHPVNSEPMSFGTRCRQLAEYVVFFAPLSMLCDSPSNYLAEKECAEFMAKVPTVWDETVGVDGNSTDYVVIARRHGDTWYLGALNDWTERTLEIDLGFIGGGAFEITAFSDGPNASKAARDYRKSVSQLSSDRKLSVRLAPGGGFAAAIKPIG